MSKPLGLLACFLATLGQAHAQNCPSDKSWQQIRDQQPATLHLKLTLPRAEFMQGDKIPATLDYTNDDPAHPCQIWIGGAGPGGVFCAEDDNGNPVADPEAWDRMSIPSMGEGLSILRPIGSYSTTLRVNRNVRFDHPGHYTLYAEASLHSDRLHQSPEVWIVSDKIPITIIPLTPDREKQIIAEALAQIASESEATIQEGFDELNDLQTPAAREAELPLLGKPWFAWRAGQGFLQAVDPASEVDRMLVAVKAGKLILGSDGILVYGVARASRAMTNQNTAGMSDQELRTGYKQIHDAESKAEKEMADALVASFGQGGPNQVYVLWTEFEHTAPHGAYGQPDPDGGRARAAVVKHQLELPPDEVKELFDNWAWWGCPAFLPLVRREAGLPRPNPTAVAILAKLESKNTNSNPSATPP